MERGSIHAYKGILPKIGENVFIAPGAHIIGDVTIGAGSSIWFNCVVRGDVYDIRIGAGSNIQDGSVLHVTSGRFRVEIGDNVLVGHKAIVHGCVVESGAMIGMAATVMDQVVVESGAMVAAGALVTPGKRVRAGEVWAGAPARPMRELTAAARAFLIEGPCHYAELARTELAKQT